MKGRNVVKELMDTNDVSIANLAARLGITGAAMWDRINTKKAKDIPASTLTEILRQLDYKLVAVPRSTRLPNGSYEID